MAPEVPERDDNATATADPELQRLRHAVHLRRTFAIISHPDAGKTTLTEKLLLYGGAVHLAGSVKQRAGGRQTTSDWMEIERQRGISISTSVLQFTYAGKHLNLLDTPGHNDFSEDTYRTLAAADAAVMLIDSVKGVEPQTIKLFQVCRMRHIPIVTFINKMDRAGRDPFDLLDEIERVLGIPCSPVTWPAGSGTSFIGVQDRWRGKLLTFERVEGGSRPVPITEASFGDPDVRQVLGETATAKVVDELALLDTAGNPFDRDEFLQGKVTPVFFGSAMNNFGVEPFLDHFVDLCPPPRPRETSVGTLAPDDPRFSGFVFKIQANMDPQHRDRIAFMRICSGRFQRGMEVLHVRTAKPMTLARPVQFLAQERTVIDEAFSGDIIGVWDPGLLRIGDALCQGAPREFEGIPRFSPEHFVRVRLEDPLKRKQLKKGLDQLSEEGAVQIFFDRLRLEREPILGAVGVLQFEVIQQRLKSEYRVSAGFDRLPYQFARWLEGDGIERPEILDKFELPGRETCVLDVENRPVVLFDSEWLLRMAENDHPNLKFIAAVQPGRSNRGT
jgi:peptide chain release factor 3